MSFSSGTFSLVAGNPVVTGTTISSTVQNNTMTDVATGLSTCILKDGTQTTTAAVPFITGVIAGSTTMAVFNTVATTVNAFGAATTLNIGAATGTATVSNTTLAAKAITASTTLVVTSDTALNGANITTTATTVTALAGATTLLTIGGTGSSAVVALPGTLDASNSTTGALKTAGGLAVAKKGYFGSDVGVNGTIGSTGVAYFGSGSAAGGAGGGGASLAARSDQGTGWGFEISTSADTGGGFFAAFVNQSNVKQGGISATNSTTTAFATSSDKTKKIDKGLASDVSGLLATEVHDFEWIENGVVDRGVFAQDAIKALARPILYNAKENWWGADYSKYVPDLIVLIQQHHATIAQLRSDFDAYVKAHP